MIYEITDLRECIVLTEDGIEPGTESLYQYYYRICETSALSFDKSKQPVFILKPIDGFFYVIAPVKSIRITSTIECEHCGSLLDKEGKIIEEG